MISRCQPMKAISSNSTMTTQMTPPTASTTTTAAGAGDSARRRSSYRYVSDDGARRILEYKYSGSDASLLYNHVVSPLAQQLVDRVLPPNLAPNTITISGLSLVIFAHVCMLWCVYMCELEHERFSCEEHAY